MNLRASLTYFTLKVQICYADKGFEPIFVDHESNMLPVTSTRINLNIKFK
jgi:hypothetical protein